MNKKCKPLKVSIHLDQLELYEQLDIRPSNESQLPSEEVELRPINSDVNHLVKEMRIYIVNECDGKEFVSYNI